MKKRILLPLLAFLLVSGTTASAHPPTEIMFTYDLEKQQAAIEAKHLSDDPDEDYLKKMIFFRNGEEFKTEYFQRQRNRLYFKTDVAFVAEEGDELEVKIYSAEGGSKTAVLTVEKAPEEGDEESEVAETPPAKPAKKSFSSGSKKGSSY